MDRLTRRHSDGSVGISQFRYYNYDDCQKMMQKLAYYEDAEEQGLLLRLPCAEGTTVYRIVMSFPLTDDYEKPEHWYSIEEQGFNLNMLSDFDKKIFLTREEAEKVLRSKYKPTEICGTTNLECIKCNPGPCNHRK